MKLFFQIFFLLVLFVSCHSTDKEQAQNDEPSYDFLFEQIEQQQEQKKQDYINTMEKKSIVFEQIGDCDEDDFDSLAETKHPLINTSEIKDSSLFVEFKFLDSCCQEFFGDYKIKNDTLVFKFEAVGSTACDCYCWYTYKLRIEHIANAFSDFEVVYW
ncbi:MAG: hypothetical protein C0592_11785 [Marinilabiliales bacterium]|mgnify:CR=1 FL=1|nr:MAG: hypothetical protein C0592_11785 [Marinilabiliales bacterium]